MKLASLIDNEFRSGLAKLRASSDLSMAFNFKLEPVLESVDAELAKYEMVRQAAFKKYGSLKEDGSVLLAELDGLMRVVFKTEEDAKTFNTEHEALANTDVNVLKLKIGDILSENIKMTNEEFKKVKTVLVEGYDKVVGKEETKS